MLLFKHLFSELFPVYRFYFAGEGEGEGEGAGGSGGKGEGEGEGKGEKKFAGKYNSVEDLEKAYTELETQQGASSKKLKHLESELNTLKTKKPKEGDDKKPETGKAQHAYRKFMEESNLDELSGRELANWMDKRDELRDAAKDERKAEAKAAKSKVSDEASQEALKGLMEADTKRLLKIKKYSQDELEELIDWGDEHGCGSLTEAHLLRENETLAKDHKDLKDKLDKLEKEADKGERRLTGLRRREKGSEGEDGKPLIYGNRRIANNVRLRGADTNPKLLEGHRNMMRELAGIKKGG